MGINRKTYILELIKVKQDDGGSKKILIFDRTDKILVRTERIGYFTKSVRHPRDEKGRAFSTGDKI